MYLPLRKSSEKRTFGRAGARGIWLLLGLAFAGLVVFAGTFSAHAACSNPSPMPAGYASPCPVFSVSPASVSQSGTETLSAAPQLGTDYIYTTAYYAKGSTWLPVTLSGNNAAPSYSSGPATGTLNASILSTLTPGTNYIVLWDWLWDATAQCYKGPRLNQCNTGTWRVQMFNLTSSTQGAAVSISPTTLTFPSTQVGVTSAPLTFTVTNVGNAALSLASNSISGDFNFAGIGTCGQITSLAAGASCTYSANFTPTAIGSRIGQETIFNNAPTSPQTVTLTGIGSSSSGYTYSQPTYTGYIYSQAAYTSGCTSGCNNYYVSPIGSDSNSGTQASPWKTLQKANDAFALGTNGAVIHVQSGTYTAVVTCVDFSGVVCLSRGGSSTTVRVRWQCDAPLSCLIRNGSGGFVVASLASGDNNIDIVGFDVGNAPNGLFGFMAEWTGSAAQSLSGNSVHVIGNYFHDIAQTYNGAYGGRLSRYGHGPISESARPLPHRS
jgi:hypothetical protein